MAAYPVEDKEELRQILILLDEINPLISMMVEFEARTGLRYVDISKLTFSKLMVNGTVRKAFEIVQSKPYNARLKSIRDKAIKQNLTPSEVKKKEQEAKQKSKIVIHVNEPLKELIWRLYLVNGSHKLVFQSTHHHVKTEKSISIQYVNQSLKKVGTQLAIPHDLSTHSLRKSFAMFLLDMGASIKVVKESLGHSSLNATEHYLMTFTDEKKGYVTKVDF